MTEAVSVGVLGAGAVGCYFGGRLAQGDVDVTLVARPAHAEAIARAGLVIRSGGHEQTVQLAATTDPAVLARADVILVTVKSVDTEATAALVDRHVSPASPIISFQNGVDNAWRLQERLSRHAVVPGVVYVSAEMAGPGIVRHNGGGRLVVGAPLAAGPEADKAHRRLEAFVAACAAADVVCDRSDDVRVDLWTKLATNCAYNALSALSGLRYGQFVVHDDVRGVMTAVTDELVAVAQADGVALSLHDAHTAVWRIAEVMPGALSSTAQDLQAGRRTEIDALNGYVVRRGEALGVPTPVNRTLAALVRLKEQTHG